MDLALNNLQRLICHKTEQTKPNQRIEETYGYSDSPGKLSANAGVKNSQKE